MELETGKGDWRHSLFYSQADACYEWSLRPSDIGLCEPDDDINWMVAYLQAKRKMAAYEIEQQERERERRELTAKAQRMR